MGPAASSLGPPPQGIAVTEGSDKPLWGGRFRRAPAPEVLRLTASIRFDRRLWREDLQATAAHARALERAGLLDAGERSRIEEAIAEATGLFSSEQFPFDPRDEDIHSAVERFLTERLGDVGAKIHAGRSRNDLVVADLRLWIKKAVVDIAAGVGRLMDGLYRQARANEGSLAPSYTHLQRAQPVLLPHLLLAHAFALSRDFDRLVASYGRADVSPLGAAALAGTTLPIDPKATAADLGFGGVFDNAADAVSDRDFVLEFLAACAILAVHVSRLGEDIVLWASSEFGFVVLDDAYATGSSIMPQKKNPDVAEHARAKSSRITAHLVHVLGALKGLPLAYDGDLQEDKEAVFDTADSLIAMLDAMAGLVRTLEFETGRLAEAASAGGNLATDLAEALVVSGVPFRRAHEMVGQLVARCEAQGMALIELTAAEAAEVIPGFDPAVLRVLDPRRAVEARRSHGGTAPERIAEQLDRIESLLDQQRRWLNAFGRT